MLKKSGARNFIIWGSAGMARRVLGACSRVGLLDARHAYLVLSLELHTRPLAALSHGGANVTALRLRDPTHHNVLAARELYVPNNVAFLG